MVKKLSLILLIPVVTVVLLYFIGYWNNNKTATMPARSEIKQSFDHAVDWLVNHKQHIYNHHNSALWWMIMHASQLTRDARLVEIYDTYHKSFISRHSSNVWMSYFDKDLRPYVPDIIMMDELAEYQLFFVYSLTCDAEWAREPVIKSQLSPDYCELHFFHPRCVTHQLMGVRLLLERDCLDKKQLNGLVSELQNIIITELVWDFRVTDAYIQRILTLQESGAGTMIKPVWLQRFLAAQNEDGGWDNFHPIINLPGGYAAGFTTTKPALMKNTSSNFHATAQAIWLLALLQQE